MISLISHIIVTVSHSKIIIQMSPKSHDSTQPDKTQAVNKQTHLH